MSERCGGHSLEETTYRSRILLCMGLIRMMSCTFLLCNMQGSYGHGKPGEVIEFYFQAWKSPGNVLYSYFHSRSLIKRINIYIKRNFFGVNSVEYFFFSKYISTRTKLPQEVFGPMNRTKYFF